jgi:hypothetical protein
MEVVKLTIFFDDDTTCSYVMPFHEQLLFNWENVRAYGIKRIAVTTERARE